MELQLWGLRVIFGRSRKWEERVEHQPCAAGMENRKSGQGSEGTVNNEKSSPAGGLAVDAGVLQE